MILKRYSETLTKNFPHFCKVFLLTMISNFVIINNIVDANRVYNSHILLKGEYYDTV